MMRANLDFIHHDACIFFVDRVHSLLRRTAFCIYYWETAIQTYRQAFMGLISLQVSFELSIIYIYTATHTRNKINGMRSLQAVKLIRPIKSTVEASMRELHAAAQHMKRAGEWFVIVLVYVRVRVLFTLRQRARHHARMHAA